MTGTMGGLLLAAGAFLAIHIIPSSVLRIRIVAAIGEKAYLAGFSLLSIAALVWMVFAFNAAPVGDTLWYAGNAGRHIGMLLMLIASILFISALTSPNPTAVGAGGLIDKESAYSGINAITRHPMMWSFVLWSITHIINNGETSALIFFGTFGALALAGTFLIDAKKARQLGDSWAQYSARTSNIPFAAVLAGRAKLSFRRLWWRILLGVIFCTLLIFLHEPVFGVSPHPV
ncbi:MAG: NnrU family protein [Sneathiella sp.]|uniref:NnrU family protein n=1 Tax=Sneathiella sp. TaxID=1964365 RepID=UPI000C42E6DB|nr:NnrU family protein [Sneathiella sp.]MAL80486.1 NnrU family protein [Sneathiella sp.]